MSHSLSRVFVHLVWGTKGRRPWITPSVEGLVHAAVRGQCERLRCEVIGVGAADDHVHLLVRLALTADVASLVRACKSASSSAVRRTGGIADFEWQTGYGAMSIAGSSAPGVAAYVIDQRRRHADGAIDPELESTERADSPVGDGVADRNQP